MTDFRTWTEPKARELLDAALPKEVKANEKFVEGDHWQNGDGWIGPKPAVSDTGYSASMEAIATGFVSRNAIGEVVSRHVTGVLGKEPGWSYTPRRALKEGESPSTEEQARINELSVLIQQWADKRKLWSFLSKAAGQLLWGSRSMVRFYIPLGLTEEATAEGAAVSHRVVRAASVEEALDKIYLDNPLPAVGGIVEDEDTKQELGVTFTTLTDGRRQVEFVFREPNNKQTVIRIMRDRENDEALLDLGGRLTVFEMRRPLLITRQVQESQKALNLALTVIPRTVVTSGWLERVLLNAQMPGKYEEVDGKRVFVPGRYVTGPNTTQFVQGVPYEDAQGNQQLADPSIQWREPVTTEFAENTKRSHYQDILEETDQSHVLIAGDATASGVSRQQARADFLSSLRRTQQEVEACGVWLLETVVAMAEVIAGQRGRYTRLLRADFQCRLDSGPLTPDEIRVNLEQLDKRVLSRETVMSRNGVSDVDSELNQISSELETQLKFVDTLGDTLTKLTGSGLSAEAAVTLLSELTDLDQTVIDTVMAELTIPTEEPTNPNPIPPPTPEA